MNKNIAFTILIALLFIPLCMQAQKKTKKVKAQEVPQLLNYPSAEWGEYRMHGGNVVFQGSLVVPEEAKGEKMQQELIDMMNGCFTVIMRDYIVGKEKTSVIEFKNDGTFSMNVYVPYPMFVLVYPLGTAYACPGDTVSVTIDTTKQTKEEGVILDGTGLGGEVTRLYQLVDQKYCKFVRPEKVYDSESDSLMMWRDEQVARLDDMVRQMNAGLPELEGCSLMASDILRTYIVSQYVEYICDTYASAEFKLIQNENRMPSEAFWQQFFSFVAPREKYMTDNPLLMISADEFFFNRVEFHLFSPINAGRVVAPLPFDYDPQFAQILTKEKIETTREFRMNAMKELQEKLHVSPTDFSAQVCQLRSAFSTLEWHGNRYDQAADDVAATMSVITHPELIRQGILSFRDYVKENEIQVVDDKLMTKGDSIFQRIIEPYKGNVLYVDFWEMSCGPCRAKMLSMRDEVEANKDKPVKYLYITDDTPEQCKPFLEPNNIQGEHIHITRSEWGYLQEKFQFSGIPFVVLYDKQGKQRKDVTVEQLLAE
jgi:thiol-disulfide isomerase/thioredoxin